MCKTAVPTFCLKPARAGAHLPVGTEMEVSFLSYLLAVLVPIIFSLGFISTLLGFVGLLLAAGIISSFIWSLPKRTVQER